MQPNISILHPSWKRPALAMQCHDEWIAKADNPQQIEYILCLAGNDPTLDRYQANFYGTGATIVISEQNGLIKQVNEAARHSTGNLLVAVSDDFVCPEHWDTILLTALEGKEDYVVKTQDGLQPFIMTLPIMDRAFYNRFGYIYHPDYFHMYGDEELALVGKILGKTITLDVLFQHNHYSTGANPKDEVNQKNDSFMMVDRETFKARKEKNFGL